MANYLADLALGLRNAGGILNPAIQKANIEQDQYQMQVEQQRKQLVAQQVIKAAEMGAIAPEAAKAQLETLGYGGVPVGPSLDAQQKAIAIRRDAAAQRFLQQPQVQALIANGDPQSLRAVTNGLVGIGVVDPMKYLADLRAENKPVAVGANGLAIPDATVPGGYRMLGGGDQQGKSAQERNMSYILSIRQKAEAAARGEGPPPTPEELNRAEFIYKVMQTKVDPNTGASSVINYGDKFDPSRNFGIGGQAAPPQAGQQDYSTSSFAGNPSQIAAEIQRIQDPQARAQLATAFQQVGVNRGQPAQRPTVDFQPGPAKITPLSAEAKLNQDFRNGLITREQYDRAIGARPGNPDGVLSPEAIDAAAARYTMDGTLPPNLGRGAQGAANTALILQKAAENARAEGKTPEASRLDQIANKANSQALGQLVKQKNLILAFEKNALMNADLVIDRASKVDKLGSPVIDRWLLAGRKAIAGDPAVAELDAAMRTFVNEYARITTSVTGGGVTSDTARREIDQLLNSAQSPQQIKGVVSLMKQEMENRRIGYEQQEAALKASMRGGSASPEPQPAAATPAAPKTVDFGSLKK